LKRACEVDLGTVLIVVTRVINTAVGHFVLFLFYYFPWIGMKEHRNGIIGSELMLIDTLNSINTVTEMQKCVA